MREQLDDDLATAFAEFRAAATRAVRPTEPAKIRAGARVRRRRERASRAALGTLMCVAVLAAVFVVGRPLGTDPTPTALLTVNDLIGRPVELPPWPDLPAAGALACPRGMITSAFQFEPSGAVAVTIKSIITVDVNSDRRPDLVAALSCLHSSLSGEVALEQVVAFSGTPGGPVSVIGQVTTTSMDAREVVTLGSRTSQDTVTVRFRDHLAAAVNVARIQERTYSFDGAAFRQIDGPTEFGPNPDLVSVVMIAEPLVMRPAESAATTGTLRIVVRSVGPGAVTALKFMIEVRNGYTIADPTCIPTSDSHNDPDPFYRCGSGPLAPGQERVLTYAVTGPATVTADPPTAFAAVVSAVSPKGPLAEAALGDNFATIPVTMG